MKYPPKGKKWKREFTFEGDSKIKNALAIILEPGTKNFDFFFFQGFHVPYDLVWRQDMKWLSSKHVEGKIVTMARQTVKNKFNQKYVLK